MQWPLATRLSDQEQVSPGCRNFRDMNIKQFLPFETVECTLLFNLLLSPDALQKSIFLIIHKTAKGNIFCKYIYSFGFSNNSEDI